MGVGALLKEPNRERGCARILTGFTPCSFRRTKNVNICNLESDKNYCELNDIFINRSNQLAAPILSSIMPALPTVPLKLIGSPRKEH